MKIVGIYIVCFVCLLSCKSQQVLTKDNERAAEAKMVPDSFEISSTWANPIGNSAINAIGIQGGLGSEAAGSRINIAGNANYVRKKGDRLEIYLPYYGTRTTGATPLVNRGYSSIQFEGIPDNYVETNNADKDRIQITFDVTDSNGRHNFLIKVFDNGSVTMDVNATHRSRIQYEGTLVAID